MNAGQIIMSMMQDVPKSVTLDAAFMADGEQMQTDGGFADLLCTLQAKAGQSPNASQLQSEVLKLESEPVDVSVEDFIADEVQSNMAVNAAAVQMLLAAYAPTAEKPIVSNPTCYEVGAVQNPPEVRKAEQPAEAFGAKPELEQAVELQLGTAKVSVTNQSMPLQQNGRMPTVNTQPNHDVDSVQNVSTVPKVQSVEPVQSTPPSVAEQELSPVSESVTLPEARLKQQKEEPKTPEVFEMAPKVAEASVQPQSSTPLQQNGRMPSVNLQPSHEFDAVQNVLAASKAEQPSVEPAQSEQRSIGEHNPSPVSEQSARQSATVEMAPKAAEAALQPQPSTPLQQNGRMPLVSPRPIHEVDAVQNVLAVPKVEQPSVTLESTQETQAVGLASRTLEEITFSLSRPISFPRKSQLESSRVPQSAPVLTPQIISLNLNKLQSGTAEFETASALPEGAYSSRYHAAGGTPTAVMPANSETGLTPKTLPETAMPGTSTGTLELQPETDVLVKKVADIHSVSQQPVLNASARLVPDARIENDRAKNTMSFAKENLLSQQNMAPVGEVALTSGDSMGNSGDQAWPGQTSDNQMVNHQVHVQSKSEQQPFGPVSSNRINAEQPRQELPEQVAHQVRERLNQYDVKPGNQQITLTLSPENLGELKMNLNLQGQRLSVEIVAENRAVRDTILQHSDSLKESLARQNISVESFDVTANGRGAGNPGHNQDAWKELARQKQQQYWTSADGYHPLQVEVSTNPLAYQAKNEHAMLDIHY